MAKGLRSGIDLRLPPGEAAIAAWAWAPWRRLVRDWYREMAYSMAISCAQRDIDLLQMHETATNWSRPQKEYIYIYRNNGWIWLKLKHLWYTFRWVCHLDGASLQHNRTLPPTCAAFSAISVLASMASWLNTCKVGEWHVHSRYVPQTFY